MGFGLFDRDFQNKMNKLREQRDRLNKPWEQHAQHDDNEVNFYCEEDHDEWECED